MKLIHPKILEYAESGRYVAFTVHWCASHQHYMRLSSGKCVYNVRNVTESNLTKFVTQNIHI